MTDHKFSSNRDDSDAFEKAALARYRKMILILPDACRLRREVWDQSTVLCLDFQDCPDDLSSIKKQDLMLLVGAEHLGLAQALSFRLGNKIKGWSNFATTDA
ncbi:hypothetical protein [[Leptolyngbya] sp. PCC 7376]|uniref:hypothetical protein n=1 Tax=[Leptolyngbya] sp. PCC 7376 TaxID=111781 RepID=UPI0002E74E6D|nr:hypothetical protein [[Leptolyngbya] sp. PCC 7376]